MKVNVLGRMATVKPRPCSALTPSRPAAPNRSERPPPLDLELGLSLPAGSTLAENRRQAVFRLDAGAKSCERYQRRSAPTRDVELCYVCVADR